MNQDPNQPDPGYGARVFNTARRPDLESWRNPRFDQYADQDSPDAIAARIDEAEQEFQKQLADGKKGAA